MKKRLRVVLVILILTGAAIVTYKKYFESDDATRLQFSGNIEVTEHQLSFKIAGHLQERSVEEGDMVKAGQQLAKLESSDQVLRVHQAEADVAYAKAVLKEFEAGSRKEEVARAEARVQEARHNLSELQTGSRIQEIESGKAELDKAIAAEKSAMVQLQQRKIDLDRYTKLYESESISKNVYELFKNQYETADNRVKEAKAQSRAAQEQLELLQTGPRIEQIRQAEAIVKQAEADYDLVKAGPREETIDQARAQVTSRTQTLQLAQNQLGYTKLFSPVEGVVLSVAAEVGEYLNPASPVLTVGQIYKPWLRAYVGEKDLGRVQLQQTVVVTTDSYPGKHYQGRVTFISSRAEFTPKIVQTFEERVKLMYRIKVSLDNPHYELKPGMPADGVIEFIQTKEN